MNRTPRLICFLVFSPFFFLLPLRTNAQSNPLQANPLDMIAQQLQGLEASQDGLPSTDVPPSAQELLPKMKTELRSLTLQTLNAHPAASAENLRTFLITDLRSAGLEVLSGKQFENNYNTEADKFGFVQDVQVRQPTRHPDLLVVIFSLTIPCGVDDSLTVFRIGGSGWQPLIASDSNGYATVADAQGWVKYAVSPSDSSGEWFLVTANVSPWCTSNWQGLHYKVLRPGDSAQTPRVLLDEHTGVYIGVDEPYRITTTRNGFTIHNVDSQSLDPSILTRVHVQKYEVTTEHAKRVPPFALFPEDFLDEWFNLKWEEAALWILAGDKSEFQSWHDRFNRPKRNEGFYTEFDFVQPCPSPATEARWQIGLELEGTAEKDLPEDLPEELFFTVIKRDGAFYLSGLADERPKGCPGESHPQSHGLENPLP
jgi:hypothetical protein